MNIASTGTTTPFVAKKIRTFPPARLPFTFGLAPPMPVPLLEIAASMYVRI